MPETQLNIGATVGRNLMTYFIFSAVTFACAMLGSIVTHLVVCIAVAAFAGAVLALLLNVEREKKRIIVAANVVLLGFGVLGVSLEFQNKLRVFAEPLSYFSIGLFFHQFGNILNRSPG
jgi:MFS-type transporter involved in bile tolerance (Atg22 family)